MQLKSSPKAVQKCLDLITKRGLLSVHSKLSVTRQSELLDVNRTSVYYVPVEKDLKHENMVKERLDYWHTKMPYMGVRKLRIKLYIEDGIEAGRKLIKRCMDEMGIYAVYPKPNLSKRNQKHKVYSYLLRNLVIARPNKVWAVDITYIKMGRSHMYMTAVIDWYNRYIVGWALSDTLDTAPVLDAVASAIEKYGKPRWVDNVIIERWFRSLKTEYIYTNELETPRKLRAGIAGYAIEYNHERPHQSHDYQVPYEV